VRRGPKPAAASRARRVRASGAAVRSPTIPRRTAACGRGASYRGAASLPRQSRRALLSGSNGRLCGRAGPGGGGSRQTIFARIHGWLSPPVLFPPPRGKPSVMLQSKGLPMTAVWGLRVRIGVRPATGKGGCFDAHESLRHLGFAPGGSAGQR
jgi:hypothetical protein